MEIVVLTGSPRKNGNSSILADNFIKGATKKGHNVIRFDTAFKKVHACIDCNQCRTGNSCILNDDFNSIKDNLIKADMIVFVTPMYYFGVSAQLKTVIDRFYSINVELSTPKKSALILTYADTSAREAEPIKNQYEIFLDYLGWQDMGQIIASGVWTEGAVNNTDYPKQAYELGKSL